MKKVLTIVLVSILLVSCSTIRNPNDPFRTYEKAMTCDQIPNSVPSIEGGTAACGNTVVEHHENHSIGYIEFTERGNLFSDSRTKFVLNEISKEAKSEKGVAVVVFVHGWKHNSRADDSNVIEFNELLDQFAANELLGSSNRKVYGVYVGWRGSSYPWGWLENLTFWDRKAVAEEVGAGGVTSVLTQLQSLLVVKDDQRRAGFKKQINGARAQPFGDNSLLIIGHSFGAAIVLSSLSDVYVNSLAKTYASRDETKKISCENINRFADGVVLLNPAIEANLIFPIKELASNCQFGDNQPRIMHVISSDADVATKWAFPAGQWLDLILTANQDELDRTIAGQELKINENHLDMQTVGNLELFRTGYFKKGSEVGYDWTYSSCSDSLEGCELKSQFQIDNHIPVKSNNPIVFLKTDGAFMSGHNDVFNCAVKSYVSTIVIENQARVGGNKPNTQQMTGCEFNSAKDLKNNDFGKCFTSQLKALEISRAQSCKSCLDKVCVERYCTVDCAGKKLM